jgi:hypothetical protein
MFIMKKGKSPIELPDDGRIEAEVARRIALYHIHLAARVLVDAMSYFPFEHRHVFSTITGGLNTLERHLDDLKPKAKNGN